MYTCMAKASELFAFAIAICIMHGFLMHRNTACESVWVCVCVHKVHVDLECFGAVLKLKFKRM